MAMTSKMPGLTVLPHSATLIGWIIATGFALYFFVKPSNSGLDAFPHRPVEAMLFKRFGKVRQYRFCGRSEKFCAGRIVECMIVPEKILRHLRHLFQGLCPLAKADNDP